MTLAGRGDVVVTADIPLAGRCLELGARAPRDVGDLATTRLDFARANALERASKIPESLL